MNQSHLTQIDKYGGPEGYSREMRRRQAMRQVHGTGGFRYLKQTDPARFKQMLLDREAKRKYNAQIKQEIGEPDPNPTFDRTQEV